MEQIDSKISGLRFIPKDIFKGPQGAVLKHLSIDNTEFKTFGEVYYSKTFSNQIKGWKYHLNKSQNLVVIHGEVKFVFYDDRDSSPTKGNIEQISISPDNYYMIILPPKIWYSFKCISKSESIIGNITDQPHRPEECIEKPLTDKAFPYNWP